MAATVIEITADSSDDATYHVAGKHLHMLQVLVYGWLADDDGRLVRWLESSPADLDRDAAVVYASGEDGSYLVDEKATREHLLAAYPDAEIRWTTVDEPSPETADGEQPCLIDLCVSRECDGPDCVLVGGRPATARLRRRADHEWRRAGKGDTLAQRYVERLRDDRILARAAALDPADDSLDARQTRAVADSIRDHREMDARRAAWDRQHSTG